jgi:hypothetical protein
MAAVARSDLPRIIANRASAKSLVRCGAEAGTYFRAMGFRAVGSRLMLVAAVPPSGVFERHRNQLVEIGLPA